MRGGEQGDVRYGMIYRRFRNNCGSDIDDLFEPVPLKQWHTTLLLPVFNTRHKNKHGNTYYDTHKNYTNIATHI